MRRGRQGASLALLFMTTLLLAPAFAGATIYNEIRLTHNTTNDEYPRIGGNKIVWQGWDNSDYEIYCYDVVTGETAEITHNVLLWDMYPSTDGEYILWSRTEPHEYDYSLYLHEIATGATSLLEDGPSGYSMDGGLVAWVASVPTIYEYELFLHDASIGETLQVTDDSLWDISPIVSQGRIAWIRYGGDPYIFEVVVYDPLTGETEAVHATDQQMYRFALEGNRLAWLAEEPGGMAHVVVHDLGSGETTELPDSDAPMMGDLMIAEYGLIWAESQYVETELHSRLYYWDFLTEQTRVLNDSNLSGVHALEPRIQGEDVVWYGIIFVGEEIFHHDLATGLTTQVTHDVFTDEHPSVYQGTIVWQGFDPISQHYEIYMGVPCLDGDGDGFEDAVCGGTDCNDQDPAVYPGAPGEVPGDQVDTNCNGSDDCFIATAAFGSPMDSRIEALRTFRDDFLITHPAGRALVAAYYKYSPPISETISERPWMAAMIRGMLLPVVGFALLLI